ncbi:MAG: spore maturation protein [Desulfobacteraceae bacterium]|nr:spore maturation protein [Desulfobacteraceae bacterium]
MNIIFFAIVAIAFATAGWHQITFLADGVTTAPMEALSTAMVEAAASAVELAISLVGVMTLFLGLVKVAEAGGLLSILARFIRPLMVRLFPEVPAEHPAMGAMILNMSANVLGLGNAATPFGIRAMQELDKLNPQPGTATDPMILFLAINTSSVTLLPTGVIALRAAAGSAHPAAILPSTLVATICSTTAAILASKLLKRFAKPLTAAPAPGNGPAGTLSEIQAEPLPAEAGQAYPFWVSLLALGLVIGFIPLTIAYGQAISPWVIPGLMVAFLAFGALRGVRIYEVFVEGAKEGFQVAIKIIPYLVAILVAVGMFRASGAMEIIVGWIGSWTAKVGLPPEALTMALLRPLSGSGAFGYLGAILKDPAIGPDSYIGYLVSTLQGSTETTFYVLAVYFGAVQVRRLRYGLAAALLGDLAGVAAAVGICLYLFT